MGRAKRYPSTAFRLKWWVSRSLSSGAHSRDPSAPPTLRRSAASGTCQSRKFTRRASQLNSFIVPYILNFRISLLLSANQRLNRPSCPARGALANVTNVGAGCGGRWPRRRARKRADVRRELAPAKPCGPDAPRAGVKLSGNAAWGRWCQKAGHQGEHGISRQTIAQGRPECFRRTCLLVCVSLLPNAHETAGAARTRSFPAPSV